VRPVVGVHPGTFNAGESFLGHHAFDELRHHFLAQRLIHGDFVFFFSPLARMNDPVGEIATIRH